MDEGKRTEFSISDKGVMQYNGRLCVPFDQPIKEDILKKLILVLIQYTQVAQRCIRTYNNIIGGLV